MAMPPVPPVRYATAVDGTRIAYMRYPGESPPFLQINTPGAPPIALRATMPVYAGRSSQFARGRSWVAFDWRGTGLSSYGPRPVTLDDLISDLDAVTAAVGEPVDAGVAGTACFAACTHVALRTERYRSLWLRFPSVRFADNWQANLNRAGWEVDYREHLQMIGRLMWDVSVPEASRIAAAWADGVPSSVFAEYKSAEREGDLEPILPHIEMPVWVTAEHVADSSPCREVVSVLPDATLSIWEPRATAAEQGSWERTEWERSLGSRLVVGERRATEEPLLAALSPRETDVLRLVAAGRTNAEVASNLTLSVRTVERHLENIYRKSGAANRAAASAWAIRQGLA